MFVVLMMNIFIVIRDTRTPYIGDLITGQDKGQRHNFLETFQLIFSLISLKEGREGKKKEKSHWRGSTKFSFSFPPEKESGRQNN